MAYKTIKHTKVSYNASGFISYQEIEMEKMYYMPDVIDEPNSYWTINCLNKLTGEVVLMLNECPIRTGYRVLITELNNNDVSTYHIHILNTNNELILDQSVLSSEYGLSSMRFISSAYIMPITVPVKPIGLAATVLSKNSISLTWTDNSDNEASFIIQRSLNGTTWTEVGTVNENITSYIDNGLSPSTSYQYRIIARNAFGNSLPSTKKTATTLPEVPVAPSNLLGVVSGLDVSLTWTYDVNSQNEFIVERSVYGSKVWSQIATIAAQTTSYNDIGLSSATRYEYRVKAFNLSNQSEYSNIVDVTTSAAPDAPLEFVGFADNQNGYIEFMWSDLTDETGYILERSSDGGSTWSELANIAADEFSYKDYTATPGVSYSYRIKGYNAVGDGAYSSVLELGLPGVPDAPTNLTATTAGSTQINLTWTDNSNDEVGFKLQISLDQSTWNTIYTAQAGETSYSNTGLNSTTTYYYRVFAYNDIGNSDYSNIGNAKTFLSAPINLTATVPTGLYVELNWTNTDASTVGYEIERKAGSSKTWIQIATTTVNKTTYDDENVISGVNYDYRVRSYNGDGNSDYSDVATQLLQ